MATDSGEIPVQTPRSWKALTVTLGRHVPRRLGEVEAAGRRIRAMGGKRLPKQKGK